MKNKNKAFDHSKYRDWIDPQKCIPYERNAKEHTEKQIRNIANSIKRFGWQQDTVITADNVLVIGHGRRLAALKLGCEMPFHRIDKGADELTDEDIRELRIADNQTNAETGLDVTTLSLDLNGLDFEGFEFDFDFSETVEERHEEYREETKDKVLDIVNLGKGQYLGEGLYDIPRLSPVTELPPIKEWISFNYVLTDENPEGKAVHFFIDDYQFERLWNQPEKYLDRLQRYVCVASPDFSPFGDMPHALQIYNHYRKHWVGAWLQTHGVTVIPTIRCSTDERSLDWYLDGEPHGGVVIMSAMWARNNANADITREEYTRMKKQLQPTKIFIYGENPGNMGVEDADNVEFIKNYTVRRWNS